MLDYFICFNNLEIGRRLEANVLHHGLTGSCGKKISGGEMDTSSYTFHKSGVLNW